ncbi:MAG: hypothetical protein V1838_04795 [Patescibacteria group bacterium]
MKNYIDKRGLFNFHIDKSGGVFASKKVLLRGLSLLMLVALIGWAFGDVKPVRSVGLDAVTVALDDETINTASQVTVSFEVASLSNGEVIKIYLGENSSGDEWQEGSVTTGECGCTDDGTGEAYAVNSVNAATATVPMYVQFTATTVGAAATTVTCTIGDDATDPSNPISADGYSVGVVTTDDAGAGIAYVGNANDVAVNAEVLPNLSLTIDNADASVCTTTSGVTSCDMGTVTTAAVNTGNYDVNVGTNATTSASMKVNDDQDLTSGANTIADVIENSTVTAGVEGYGLQIVENGSEWTEVDPFDDDDTPITTSPVTVATSTGPADAAGDDVTVTHRVAVASTTEAGNYSHTVTWTATADF